MRGGIDVSMFCQDWWEVTESTTISAIEVGIYWVNYCLWGVVLEVIQGWKNEVIDKTLKVIGGRYLRFSLALCF